MLDKPATLEKKRPARSAGKDRSTVSVIEKMSQRDEKGDGQPNGAFSYASYGIKGLSSRNSTPSSVSCRSRAVKFLFSTEGPFAMLF